uniref:hypothetical protein n=1 Tax=Bacillus testis TaxID=1622072 RepID=UPI000B0DB8D8|nr:hypothetical protein [Bacillus testis]
MLDTVLYKDDHLHDFARKNARLRFSLFPQEPTPNDTQTLNEYHKDLRKFDTRKRYIDGLHTNSTYTTMAHFWLIKELVQAKEWRFVTDNDTSLMAAMYRIFSEDFTSFSAHHFLCLTDREKTRKEAYNEFKEAKEDLLNWGYSMGIESKSLYTLALSYLEDLFENQGHQFHEEIVLPTNRYTVKADKPILHPLASIDKGHAAVDCTTDLSSYEPEEVAKMILNVNAHATNFFIQQIRRKLSVLERPLTTARGDKKSLFTLISIRNMLKWL